MKAYCIIGPPGCGKTTEILRRIKVLVDARIDPRKIMFLSFTKAAAQEALSRMGLKRSDNVCTIHSLCYRLCEMTSSSVVDHTKLKDFGQRIGIDFTGNVMDTGETMGLGDQYMAVLSRARARMVTPEEEWQGSSRPGDRQDFKSFCTGYESWKKSNGYADFTDMLENYLHGGGDHGASHIFIDEAQDLSDLQWAVIQRVITQATVKQVHVVGDDDQAIYEWSGANPAGIARFGQEYDSKYEVLSQSWRVPNSVHALANKVIGRVKSRIAKEYRPREEAGLIRRVQFFSESMLIPGEGTLILCRNFVSKSRVEKDLIQAAIPFHSEGGRGSPFQNRIANAIRAFKKMQRSEALSKDEINVIIAVGDSTTKKAMSAKDFKIVVARGYMRSLLIPPSLIDFYRSVDLEAKPSVRVSTIHSAKGREADRVILDTELTQKTISDMENNPDAEARVFYVAVTRARHKLDIIESQNGYPL